MSSNEPVLPNNGTAQRVPSTKSKLSKSPKRRNKRHLEIENAKHLREFLGHSVAEQLIKDAHEFARFSQVSKSRSKEHKDRLSNPIIPQLQNDQHAASSGFSRLDQRDNVLGDDA